MLKAVTVFVMIAALLFATAPTATAAQVAGVSIPITIPAAGGGVFNGTLSLTSFAVQNGQLVANGTLAGTVTNAAGQLVGSVLRTVTLAVTATGSCEILHLELGPLDLTLLGLVVHLDKVVLDITAQSGPGNLLGNLLCAVANLLNGNGALNNIANLLNQILGQL